jgi:ABC-type glycerol-3-phosphate transport system permease component
MAGGVAPNILNSVIICAGAISLALLLASYTSYVFARLSFPGKEAFYSAIIVLLMVPFLLSLIPEYFLILKLGLADTRWALIFPYAAGGSVFGCFLLRPFMASIPEELFEAARIDGAGDWQAFYLVAIPLSLPILATLVIILMLSEWNEFIWAVTVITSKDLYTVPLGIWSIPNAVLGPEPTAWGRVFAAFTVASLPIIVVFFVFRNAFIKGLSSGALKM